MDKDRVKTVVAQMTLEEKVALTEIGGALRLEALSRLKVPMVKLPRELSPIGERLLPFAALGHTFDCELVKAFARLRLREAFVSGESFGGIVSLAVARDPFDEDAKDAFSDDPFTVSRFVSAFLSGAGLPVIGRGIFGGGGFYRNIDARALNEIYLRPFADNKEDLGGVCIPSGRLGGVPAAENRMLVKKLSDGFDGLIINEAGSCEDKAEEVSSGACLDILSKSGSRERLYNAVSRGLLAERKLDVCVERNVYNAAVCYKKVKDSRPPDITADFADALYRRLSEECAVLLKNDGVLPVKDSDKWAAIGADIFGTSKKTEKINLKTLEKYAGAAKKAGGFDKIAVYIEDVHKLDPESLKRAVSKLSETAKVILVLASPCYFEMPYFDDASAIVYLPYTDKHTLKTLKRLLTGEIDFSGRLSLNWAFVQRDYPRASFADGFYGESVYTGGRYFAVKGEKLRFPIGYGLSYANATLSDLEITDGEKGMRLEFGAVSDRPMEIPVTVTASLKGDRLGISGAVVAFDRISVGAEKTRFALDIDKRSISVYNAETDDFDAVGGEFTFTISSGATTASVTVKLKGISADDAEEYLTESGFDLKTVEKRSGVQTKVPALDPNVLKRAEKILTKAHKKKFPKESVASISETYSPEARIRLAEYLKRDKM